MYFRDDERGPHIERIGEFLQTLRMKPGISEGIIRRSPVRKAAMAMRGVGDYCRLLSRVVIRKRSPIVVFITRSLVLYERFLKTLDLNGAIVINYHQTEIIESFMGKRVFNIGILVGMLKRLPWRRRSFVHDVAAFGSLYGKIRWLMRDSDVFIPCYYDASGLALVFDRERSSFRLTEVQHGGICNFEPYARPVPFPVADRILVFDERTAAYLGDHLCRGTATKIEIMKSEASERISRVNNPRPVILYCSTIEIDGIHEKFLAFLRECDQTAEFDLRVRLHPRERNKKERFASRLRAEGVDFEFDESPDWITGNPFERLVVVTPWSSVIEEAYRNGICSVILDQFGRERFLDLVDGSLCWFADDVCRTFGEVLRILREIEVREREER